MGSQLPPDLERLGAALTTATARAAAARRHRVAIARRLAACFAAAVLVFAASPYHLGPATAPTGGLFDVESAYGQVHRDPCDPPHGAAADCLVGDPPPQVR